MAPIDVLILTFYAHLFCSTMVAVGAFMLVVAGIAALVKKLV